ncbi:hypothetical protein VSH64_15890 [Amycolatopsis rhabdoformis]|uniref:Uncharacterized protein n=1 Tax=Amycolatopsis rhabdoformis TaxID=1448059 RepID=A0ABZ1IGM7_9PSEU|nr:hypothetical protein [Amycolatopsis rhabdoformis]WSE33569.1 hypothetical protein VSH64_15890 [Amycolatopsis rhabdoformis]
MHEPARRHLNGLTTKAEWPTRDAGGYPPGWQVRYLCRVRGPAGRRRAGAGSEWQERSGTIAGRSLRDEHTSTTWVPVRQRDTAPDAPVNLVRATDILHAEPPGD